jgi:hypothetical protein
MFGLTLTDHLRLTFGHVIYSHRTHAEIADRHSRWHRWLTIGGAGLMLVAAISALASVFTGQSMYATTAAVAAVIAVIGAIVQLVGGFDRSAQAHRACSAHLWRIREQYRALLADLHDGAITIEVARERRDALMASLHRVYENAPPPDREVYRAARQGMAVTDETTLTDEEIDRFLPMSLHKTASSTS